MLVTGHKTQTKHRVIRARRIPDCSVLLCYSNTRTYVNPRASIPLASKTYPPCSLGMTLVVFSVWWLLQSVDFIYHKNIHLGAGYKLQAN